MKKILLLFLLLFLALPILCLAEQIDINSATLSQLDDIVHIGPKTAQKIIDGRPFSSVQDLSKVKGIGNGKYLQDIINQGWACVNCAAEITQTPNSTPDSSATPIPSLTPTPAIIYPTGVFINEIMPDPAGPDETDEWIELYNSNNFDVDLSGWQLQDQQGTITTFTIPKNTEILTDSFLVFKRPQTNIMLNNDGDGLNLLTPDRKAEDTMNFTKALLNQSYNKTSSEWQWSTTLTPGAVNIITTVASVSKTAAPKTTTALPKTKNSDKNNNIEPAAADLSQTSNPWVLFITAGFAAIILAAITLLIKLKLKKNVRT